MPDERLLVEHTFRHEYGRLVSLLTRSMGIRNLELVEDVVQSSLAKALRTWGQQGIPDDPSGWLYRTSRNLAIDAVRRLRLEQRIFDSILPTEAKSSEDGIELHFDAEIGDEPLRLLMLCCHPGIPFESRIVFALRTVSGFSTAEVATALLISKASAEKRLARAKEKMRELGTEISELDHRAIEARVPTVQTTIYFLLFSEGYWSSSGETTVRVELCDEAIRLARMLVRMVPYEQHSSAALLALMLMHSARFQARFDTQGSIILLADQDRASWDWGAIRESLEWMKQSIGDQASRYHIEAAIAWEHCRATSVEEALEKVVEYYRVLDQIHPGPMVRLNLAIAVSYAEGPQIGLEVLGRISAEDRSRLRPWWDCAIAEVYHRLGQMREAVSHWEDALALASNHAQRALLTNKITRSNRPQ